MWKSIVLITGVITVLLGLLFLCKTGYGPSVQHRPRPYVPQCGDGLKWTSLKAGTDKDTAFFSAYYDERKGVPNRPAVIVLGYHMKSLKNPDLRCVFTFQDGSSQCSSKPVTGIGNSCINIHDDGTLATSYTYICPLICVESMCSADEVPLFVAMSTSANCEGKSETIPVQDCRFKETESKKKLLGVCPSPVYKLGLQDILEFIEMNKALGVDLVNLYLMPGLEENMIQHLQEHYSKDRALNLKMFQWRKMPMWSTLHYNGQLLAIHDCMYRNMYRVEYLMVTDLDELIIPFKHKNYMDMINSFKAWSWSSTHSYRFLNRFFAINDSQSPTLPNCSGLTLPKYFHRTNQLKCLYNINLRPKYIMKPQFVVQVAVHGVCQVVKGREYHVSPSTAILGHFRNSIPHDCKDRRTAKQVLSMQWDMIGTFFAIRGVFQLLGVAITYVPIAFGWNIVLTFPSCGFIYYLINAIIALIGIVAYTCIARQYQYRGRDEPDNIYRYAEEYYANAQDEPNYDYDDYDNLDVHTINNSIN